MPRIIIASTIYGCEAAMITGKRMKNNQAREHAIYLSRELCGVTNALLGQQFGCISGAAVTLTRNKVVRSLDHDKHLRTKFDEIKRRILNI